MFHKMIKRTTGFELMYHILQFATHLRELVIRKKLNKIVMQKIYKKKTLQNKIIANVKM